MIVSLVPVDIPSSLIVPSEHLARPLISHFFQRLQVQDVFGQGRMKRTVEGVIKEGVSEG
jgi:hypothetical protein